MCTHLVFLTGLTALEDRGHISFISETGRSEVGAQEMTLIGGRRGRLQALRGPMELREARMRRQTQLTVLLQLLRIL